MAAYRTGHITPEQLARELQRLNARKESLLQEASNPQPKAPVPFESVEAACKHLSGRLDQMNGHEKRELVRTLVDKVVFYGDRADVFGVLPVNTNADGRQANFSNHGSVATLDFQNLGHNVPFRLAVSIIRPNRKHRIRSVPSQRTA